MIGAFDEIAATAGTVYLILPGRPGQNLSVLLRSNLQSCANIGRPVPSRSSVFRRPWRGLSASLVALLKRPRPANSRSRAEGSGIKEQLIVLSAAGRAYGKTLAQCRRNILPPHRAPRCHPEDRHRPRLMRGQRSVQARNWRGISALTQLMKLLTMPRTWRKRPLRERWQTIPFCLIFLQWTR
jgi:hypothetical protein